MDVREKLVELLSEKCMETCKQRKGYVCSVEECKRSKEKCCGFYADHLIANGVTVQECAYWQYVEDDVDEDNNIQAYCSVCGAGDKHATSMIGKVPYCWKCGRKMIPQPPKGE